MPETATLCTCLVCFLPALLPGSWSQWLAIAKLHHVAIGGTNPAVIAHRIRFLTRFPDQIPCCLCLVSDGIHRCPALEGKAQVTIVRGRLRLCLPARGRPR